MSTEDIIEKANKAISIANLVLYVVSLVLFFKFGNWFGGRWYHWIFALALTGIVQTVLGAIVKECVKAAFGLSGPSGNDEGNG